MTQPERDLGRLWFERVWNQGRREAIGEMMSPDVALHDGSIDAFGPDGFYPLFDRISATFSKIHADVRDTFAETDKLCVRWTFAGSHTGGGLGIAPTGKTIEVTGICIFRVANDRIVEAWQNWDMLGMMEQIKGVGRAATYIR